VVSSGGNGFLALNSESDGNKSSNLSVHIDENHFRKSGTQDMSLWANTQSEYNGKVIRARGKLVQDGRTKSTYLEVRSPIQILIIPEH
jgi:hypothetical protein